MEPPATPEQKVSALAARFTTAGIPHAFGGDVALGALTRPRAIARIALHAFLAPREAPPLLARLAALGLSLDRARILERIAVRGRCDLDYAGTPLALHFGLDGLHALAQERARRVPFAERYLYVLSAEDLLLEAALAQQPGEGPGLEGLAAGLGPDLDDAYLRHALTRLGGAEALPELGRLVAVPAAKPVSL